MVYTAGFNHTGLPVPQRIHF